MLGKDAIKVNSKVVEVLPNTLFRVEFSDGHRILAHASREVRLNFIRILSGDSVTVEMSPNDLAAGRITLRPKEKVSRPFVVAK